MKESVNNMKVKLHDLMQQRADHVDKATKLYSESGAQDAYREEMKTVSNLGTQIDGLIRDIGEMEKTFDAGTMTPAGDGERTQQSGKALLDHIRKSEKYSSAWVKAMRGNATPSKGGSAPEFAPLMDAERASKALTITGGDPAGEDGGFLVPLDFDLKVIEMAKDYLDLSTLVTVENVASNSGWRTVDKTGTPKPMTKVVEMAKIGKNQSPKFDQIEFSCSKYGDILPVSNELMADAQGLIQYLAKWWTPLYILTKNALVLEKLNALTMEPITGTTDTAQIKAMKHLINTGLNTATARRMSILTNQTGYDMMDNWVDNNGRAMLTADPRNPNSVLFKSKPVLYADDDILTAVTVAGKSYAPVYVGDFKSFCTLFLRQGIRMKSTDVGGDAFETDSVMIRGTCRMDCQTVNPNALKLTGFEVTG